MNNIIISTESCMDLPYKIFLPYNIKIIPLHISFGDISLADGSFSQDRIFRYFEEHQKPPATSAASIGEYIRHFETIIAENPMCCIIHISYSSSLSATYSHAVLASNEFEKGRIAVIDSKNITGGAGALVMKAAQLCEKLKYVPLNELLYAIKSYVPKIRCSFVPNTLDYLRAGGRISTITAFGSSILGIKPSIVCINGHLESGKKYRGSTDKLAFSYLDDFLRNNDIDKSFLIILYSQGLDIRTLFALKRKAHKLGIKKTWCFQTGSAITAHSGPKCIGFAGIEG